MRFTTLVCTLVPRFALRVAAGGGLPERPVALGPDAGGPPLLGEVSDAAAAQGVRPGMRMGEAIARCPELRLLTPDPAAVAEAAEELLCRLEALGAAVEPLAPGRALFAADGLLALHRGRERLLATVALALPPGGRVGAGPGRFLAQAAAVRAGPGRVLAVEPGQAASFLAPLPVERLPLEPDVADELRALGIASAGDLARLPVAAVADRLGGQGLAAWRLARGDDDTRVAPRSPPEPVEEAIDFPDPVGDEGILRGALAVLVERVLEHPTRRGRPPRRLVLSAALAGGGSWRREVALREPTALPRRLRDALLPRLLELPAAVERLGLELAELGPATGVQESLLRAPEAMRRARAAEAARQVRAGLGDGHLLRVVEVAPWSRLPEGRSLLVPYDGS